MAAIITFGGKIVDNVTPDDIEKYYGIKLANDQEEKIPLIFPNINQSSCSCDKCVTVTSIDNFKITEGKEADQCHICREKQTDKCIACIAQGKTDKCEMVE